MRYSLTWRLSAALLLVVIVSVGVMTYFINWSTTREFEQYVSSGNRMMEQRAADGLAVYYEQNQSWAGVQFILNRFIMMRQGRLILADEDGVIVGDSVPETENLGQRADKLGLDVDAGAPVIAGGQRVGTIFMVAQGAPPIRAEHDFLGRANRYLWIAGAIAAAVALLLGFLLTRQIIRPVRALTRGAREIAAGDLSHRVPVKGSGEISELARDFNQMAANLEQEEQSRRRLTADIAHELRTPLTVIQGTVRGIRDGVFKADAEHLGAIQSQSELLTRLVKDLREISLAESGRLRLELSQTDIVELARRALRHAVPQAQTAGIQTGFESEVESLPVSLDPKRLEQVVGNLISNALRHTPEGGGITVRVRRAASGELPQFETGGVVISVRDTGEGISAEHLPHIFDRFYRADDARARSDGGVGLGLAIVKQIMAAHGGQVWAESQPGQGSTFSIALPVDAA
jgi:two-component system, OmpR family, sensor histidine kinase BaeS